MQHGQQYTTTSNIYVCFCLRNIFRNDTRAVLDYIGVIRNVAYDDMQYAYVDVNVCVRRHSKEIRFY